MYLLCFYVPESHLDLVKNAIFATGAGKFDHYQHCAWQVIGQGQFMPLAGSNAFVGTPGQLEKVAEYKVEILCTEKQIKPAIIALKNSHPYETPAYQIFKLAQI